MDVCCSTLLRVVFSWDIFGEFCSTEACSTHSVMNNIKGGVEE